MAKKGKFHFIIRVDTGNDLSGYLYCAKYCTSKKVLKIVYFNKRVRKEEAGERKRDFYTQCYKTKQTALITLYVQ